MTIYQAPPISEQAVEKNGLFRHPWTRWFLTIHRYFSSFVYKSRFFGYNSSGGISINSSGVDLTITDEVKKDSVYTHSASSAEVEVTETDDYEIVAECSFSVDTDYIIEMKLFLDEGSGHSAMDGAIAYCSI